MSKPTAAHQRHYDKVSRLGCIVCRNMRFRDSPAELHHPRALGSAGKKADNMSVIPLCPQHHRLGGYGEAIHAGKESWEAIHGTELDLLAQVKELVK